MKNSTNSIYGIFALSILFVSLVSITIPRQAYAFDLGRIIDPACLFACDNDRPTKKVTNNITNTYADTNNVNSNINSPNSTVIDGNTSNSFNNTPVYTYDYPTYPNPPQNDGPLRVSCYSQPLSAQSGQTVSWFASAYGGNGSYNYSWTGSDGLSGYGSAVSKVYYSSGYKNATIRVISGNQSVSKNCDSTVYISDDYNYPQYPTYPTYPNPQYPISVSCSVSPSFIQTGSSATWTAYVSGGNGYYTYTWSGTDNLYGSSQSVYKSYYNAGTKHGSVTVYSGGQSITRSCNNSLTVGSYAPVYPVYNTYQPIYGDNNLNIGCYPEPANPRVDQPITWTVEVTGGQSPYTYSWTGSDGLSGSQSSIIKYYNKTGEKSAIVSVTSADGRSATRTCGLNANVRAAASVKPAPVTQQPVVTPPPQEDNSLSAASLFSLKNVPWGWVAVLVILVLFATVLYLLFNREKI